MIRSPIEARASAAWGRGAVAFLARASPAGGERRKERQDKEKFRLGHGCPLPRARLGIKPVAMRYRCLSRGGAALGGEEEFDIAFGAGDRALDDAGHRP